MQDLINCITQDSTGVLKWHLSHPLAVNNFTAINQCHIKEKVLLVAPQVEIMNFKKNLEAREEAFFLFQLISLKCGTNFEKTNKKKKTGEEANIWVS